MLFAWKGSSSAGCDRPIVPRILNLEASRFSSPADEDHKLCVFLEAGQYRLTLVNPTLDPNARFTAWSPAADGAWGTAYSVEPRLDAGFTTGLPVSAASAQEAFDNTTFPTVTFTLTQDQKVDVSLVDALALDNRGGVSVLLEAVPEPGTSVMLLVGGGVLAWMGRRRGGVGRS